LNGDKKDNNENPSEHVIMSEIKNRLPSHTLELFTTARRQSLTTNPHVYQVADDAYTNLNNSRVSQIILANGIGSSGKSEVLKLCTQYLLNIRTLSEPVTTNDKSNDKSSKAAKAAKRKNIIPTGPLGSHSNPYTLLPTSLDTTLHRQILASTTIIQSFASAGTTINNNSTRGITLNKVYYGGTNDVAGYSCSCILTDKSRICKQKDGERGYHIFYEMILGGGDLVKEIGCRTLSDYKCLNNLRLNDVNDELNFKTLASAFDTLNFPQQTLLDIYKTLIAILELGNVTFGDTSENSSLNAASKKSLALVETLLGLPKDSLATTLLQKAIGTTKGKTTTVPSTGDYSLNTLYTLQKNLYTKLLDSVIQRINSCIYTTSVNSMERAQSFAPHVPGVLAKEPLYVGICDCPCYDIASSSSSSSSSEDVIHGGFDDLIKHYISNKVMACCNTSLYTSQFSKYKSENITCGSIPLNFDDCTVMILDKKPQGLMCMIDEACRYPRNNDVTLLQKISSTHMRVRGGGGGGNQMICKGYKEHQNDCFVIKNSFVDVCYNVNGFLEANKDRIGGHITEVLQGSTQESVKGMFCDCEVVSVCKKVVDEVSKICDVVSNCNLLVVNCVLANTSRTVRKVDTNFVYGQLKFMDVKASVDMRIHGFTYNENFLKFYERFIIVCPANLDVRLTLVPKQGSDYKVLCTLLIQHLQKLSLSHDDIDESIYFGTTTIFLKHRTIQAYEALRKVKLQDMDRAAVLLQATWRMGGATLKYNSLKKGVSRAQASWRSVYYRQKFLIEKQSISVLQKYAMGYIARKRFMNQAKSCAAIKNFYQKLKGRVRWKKLQSTVRALHSLSRAYIVRQHVNRMLEAVSMLQSCARLFLRRNQIHYTKVRVALRIQGWYRGYKAREYMKEAVDYLASKRKERYRARAVMKAQNRWKGLMIRRRFKQLRQAACTIQQFARANARRKMFLSMKRAAIGLQSGVRGMKARDTVRTVRNEKMVAEEQLRIKESNQREAKLLSNLNSSRATATSNAKSRNFRYDLMDVDILVDNNDVYKGGWSKNAVELDNELAKKGRRISNVMVGSAHTLALTDTGELWTWGWSDSGQLGHGSHSHESAPRPLENLMFQSQTSDAVAVERAMSGRLSIKQVAVGEDHTLALGDTGKVFSWGNGKKGQLGHGDNKSIAFPRCIQALKWATTAIACGSHHSMAIGHGGALYEWGSVTAMGGVQLTNSQAKFVTPQGDICYPANMKELIKEKIRTIECGSKFSLALTYDGDVYSWGGNDFNELGRPMREADGTPVVDISKPRIIEELNLKKKIYPGVTHSTRYSGHKKHHAGITHMSAGARHSIVVNSTGQVMCWGWNDFGNLGNGDTHAYEGIHRVLGDLSGRHVVNVAAGWRNSAALTAEGDVFIWGMSSLSARDSDRPMPNLPGKKDVAVNLGPMQSISVAPKKIYRAGQSLTTAVEVHSSWSRNISTLSVTVRSRHTELPLNSAGQIDWRVYLLKKVNTLIAMQGKPEADKNLTDESREFVIKSNSGGNLSSPVKVSTAGGVGSLHATTPNGGGRVSPMPSPNKTVSAAAAANQSMLIISEKDLRSFNGNDLRTFARQLKNGEIKVQPRHDLEKRGKSPGRSAGQTFGEAQQNFFRTSIRGDDAADEDTRIREKGWNNHHNSKRDVKWSGGRNGQEELVTINREWKKRQQKEKEMLEMMASKGVDGLRLEEEEKRLKEKMVKAEVTAKKKELDTRRWRREREGKTRIEGEDILDFFKVEHLVAASNEGYTSAQVKEIYHRAGQEHKEYHSSMSGRHGADGSGGPEVTDTPPTRAEDSSLQAITRRLSLGFRSESTI
jgi:alpha-tubulin suppressor-like RCC1 family protein